MYQNTRPNSRRGRVYSTFKANGKDAAIALGRELGVKDQVLKFWFEKVFEADDVTVTPRHVARSAAKGRRVYHKGWPDMQGTIVTAGEQQSEVLWDHGHKYFANNAKLVDVR
jgi:hypothetical protein